jgi:hypothetical protein
MWAKAGWMTLLSGRVGVLYLIARGGCMHDRPRLRDPGLGRGVPRLHPRCRRRKQPRRRARQTGALRDRGAITGTGFQLGTPRSSANPRFPGALGCGFSALRRVDADQHRCRLPVRDATDRSRQPGHQVRAGAAASAVPSPATGRPQPKAGKSCSPAGFPSGRTAQDCRSVRREALRRVAATGAIDQRRGRARRFPLLPSGKACRSRPVC